MQDLNCGKAQKILVNRGGKLPNLPANGEGSRRIVDHYGGSRSGISFVRGNTYGIGYVVTCMASGNA